MFRRAEKITIQVNSAASTVDITLSQQAKHGVHRAVVGFDGLIVGDDGLCDELGDADLIDMCVIVEGLLDILQVGSSTRQDDASQELVIILRRYLIPYILDNLFQTSFDNLDEFPAFNLTFRIDGILQIVIDVVVIRISGSIFELHSFSIALFHL